jgi:hypothetical protein
MPSFDVTTIHVESRAAHTERVSASDEKEAKTKTGDLPEGFPDEGETEVLVTKV